MALDKLVDSTQLDSDLTSVANAIRTKGGTSASLAFPADFVTAIGNISGGGGYTSDDWLDVTKPTGAISSDISGEVKSILENHTGITSVSIPNVTKVSNRFLTGCTGLTSFSAPSLSNGATNMLQNCTGLNTNLFLPLFPAVTSCFENCRAPIIVCASIGNSQSNIFRSNTALTAVDVLGGTSMGGLNTFNGCTSMNVLVLRAGSVLSLGNINFFTNTPFASGKSGGTLYVPASLISSYQSASNWSTILGYTNNQIKSIESTATDPNAPVDLTTHYIDGTLIPTT